MDESNIACEILEESEGQVDMKFKIIIVGDYGVGKSCLAVQATKSKFIETYETTIGFEFSTFIVRIDDKVIKLQIWDTSGQELYRSLITNFYRTTSLAVIVYSIDQIKSFNHIDSWLKELKSYSSPDVKVILIGNKVDLESNRKVYTEEGEKFAKDNQFHYFIETSAKTGFNAKELFKKAAKILYDEHKDYVDGNITSENSFPIPNTETASMKSSFNKKKGCCS